MPRTSLKMFTTGMVPPERRNTGEAPNPRSYADSAAFIAGLVRSMRAGLAFRNVRTAKSVVDGAIPARCLRTSRSISSGRWSGTKRKLSFAAARDGITALTPGPWYPPTIPLTLREGRIVVHSYSENPRSPHLDRTRASERIFSSAGPAFAM